MKYYKILNANSKQPFIISCEHATSRIPKEFGLLGVKREDLIRCPDYYDIGSEAVSRILAKDFRAKCMLSNYSRLVINLNRQLNNPHLMPASPFGIRVPRNEKVSPKERKARLKYYFSYHKRLEKEIEALKKIHKKIHYFCIHSFFDKTPDGQQRKVDIGILYKYPKDVEYSTRVSNYLHKNSSFQIEFNQPFSAHKTAGYTINKYGKSKQVICIEFEINSKHLKKVKDIKKMSKLLSAALRNSL